MKKPLFFFLLYALYPITCALTLNAAAPVAARPGARPPAGQSPEDGRGFCIFGAQSGKSFSGEAAFRALVWKSDVIYAGEIPGRTKNISATLEILKTLRVARGSKIAVGFGALPMTLQPALDDYISGKITESGFLEKTNRAREQGFVFSFYKPLFDFILQNRLKALALDVPEETLSKTASLGLAGLGAEDKKFLPEPVNISKHKKYLEFLKSAFERPGPDSPAKKFGWDNYLASVSARNEGVGLKIADFVNANPGWSVVVIAGNDRIIYNAALPASVKTRTDKIRQASFYTKEGECPAEFPKGDKDIANYVWYIK